MSSFKKWLMIYYTLSALTAEARAECLRLGLSRRLFERPCVMTSCCGLAFTLHVINAICGDVLGFEDWSCMA